VGAWRRDVLVTQGKRSAIRQTGRRLPELLRPVTAIPGGYDLAAHCSY
jgi:hypothetical protein